MHDSRRWPNRTSNLSNKNKKKNKKRVEDKIQKMQEAQVVNYLCHLFEGAGQGEERIDHDQIKAVYEEHNNF